MDAQHTRMTARQSQAPGRGRVALAVAAAAVMIAASGLEAQPPGPAKKTVDHHIRMYIGPSGGLWSKGSNWNPPFVPDIQDEARVLGSTTASGEKTVVYDVPQGAALFNLKRLVIDSSQTEGMVVNQPFGTGTWLAVSDSEVIGANRFGTYVQKGGGHRVGGSTQARLALGVNPGSTGRYTLDTAQGGAGLDVTNSNEYIGFSGTGEFIHFVGGHATLNSRLYLGFNPGSVGKYELKVPSATLVHYQAYVGYSGHGSIIQWAGTHDHQENFAPVPAGTHSQIYPGFPF